MAAKAKKKKLKLTAAQKQRRKDARSPLLNPGALLSGTALRQAAAAETNADFKPKISALNTATKDANAQGKALVSHNDSYWQQFAAGEADRLARQKALAGDLDAKLSSIAGDTGAAIDRADAQRQAADAQDRQVRGAGLEGGGDQRVSDELAAARARSAADSQTARSGGATQGANYGNLVNAIAGARQLHGAESHRDLTTRLANQLAQFRTQKVDLQGQKADATVKNLLGLRQSGFENAATLRGLGLKEADIAAKTATAQASTNLANRKQGEVERNNRRQARLARQRNATTRHGQSVSHSDRVRGQDLGHQDRQASINARKNAQKKKRAKEPQSSINTRAAIVGVQGEYERLLHQFHGDHAKTAHTIRANARRQKKPLPEYILIAAADLANFGYVTPGHVKALKNAGVRVPHGWTVPHRSAKLSSNLA
jgi:hypothetical protein